MPSIPTIRRFAEFSLPAGQTVVGGQLVTGEPGPQTRTVTDGATTAGSTAVTSATADFQQADAGDSISGGSIPAGATIVSVQSPTAATISAAATATASAVTLTITVPVNEYADATSGNTDVAYVAGANATNVLGVALIDAAPIGSISTTAAYPASDRVTVGAHGEFPVTYAAAATVGQKLLAAANGQVTPAGAGPPSDQVVGYCTQSTAAGAVGRAYIG